MRYGYVIIYLIFIAFSLSIISCGGSRKDMESDFFDLNDNSQSSQKKTQEEKDKSDVEDLEALLGLTRDKSAKKEKKPDKKDLNLLSADEGKGNKAKKMDPLPENIQDPRMAKLNNENIQLRNKIKNKDLKIQSLESEVLSLQEQLDSEKAKKTSSSYSPPANNSYQDYSSSSSPINSYDDYKIKYDQAYAMFNERNYDGALRAFENLLSADSQNNLSDNAQYWIGECNYMKRNYQQALLDFEKVFTFPKSNKNDYAQLKIAMCYIRLGNKERAREELDRFMTDYPDSPVRNKAQDILNRI